MSARTKCLSPVAPRGGRVGGGGGGGGGNMENSVCIWERGLGGGGGSAY